MIKLKRPENRICKNCGNEFLAKRNTYGLFCSHVCVGHSTWERGLQYNRGSWLGRKHTDEWKKMMSEKLTGRTYSPETIARMSDGARNRYKKMAHPKPMVGKKHTIEARRKMSYSHKIICNPTKQPIGTRAMLAGIRNSIDGKLWREEVFKKDNYICRMCGKRGGYIHAHHIMKFSEYPEFRFEVGNGMTLCIECHRLVHKNKIILLADIIKGEVIKNNTITLAHA
jgi:hypothetical protein